MRVKGRPSFPFLSSSSTALQLQRWHSRCALGVAVAAAQPLPPPCFHPKHVTTHAKLSDFLQHDAGQLAPFLRVCHDHCAEMEGYGSSRV